MRVNLKVRIRNINFWMAIIPAFLLAVQAFAGIFGFNINFDDFGNRVVAFVNSLFVVLAILGIVNDPTTATLSDSDRAMTYRKPE